MSEPRKSTPLRSPMEEVFSWAMPSTDKRKEKIFKRRCEEDSGYTSQYSHNNTPYSENTTGYSSCDSDAGSYIINSGSKKRHISESSEVQDEKSTSCSSLPPVSSYSGFLMDASLYNEPMETEGDSLCMSMMQQSLPSMEMCKDLHASLSMSMDLKGSTLPSMEDCKDLELDLSLGRDKFKTPINTFKVESSEVSQIDADEFTTPMSSFKLILSPIKVSKMSPKKRLKSPRKNLLKKFSRSRSLNGFDRIDLLYQLGERTNHSLVVSKILDYLSDEDISALTMVSKTWKNICLSDTKTKQRWLNYVSDRKERKENLGVISKAKRCLAPLVSNLMNHSTPLQPRQSTSPPSSPSKVRFHMFHKAGQLLKDGERLVQCPHCRHPAVCSPLLKICECTSSSCKQRFCSSCMALEHSGSKCKSFIPTTPTKSTSSSRSRKRSKRYLRRL